MPTIKSWSEKSTWPHQGDQSQLDGRQRQEAVQSFTLTASDLVASFPVGHFSAWKRWRKLFQQFGSQGPSLKNPGCRRTSLR